MYAKTENIVRLIAQFFAMVGGVVLLGLTVMACLSVAGRSLTGFGFSQIEGDFELVEYGAGFAIFCFLPWTHFTAGNARVDVLKNLFSARTNATLDLVANVLMAAAALLLAWRLTLGLADKIRFGETSFILQFPVWYAYLGAAIAMAGFVLVAVFCVWRSARAWVVTP